MVSITNLFLVCIIYIIRQNKSRGSKPVSKDRMDTVKSCIWIDHVRNVDSDEPPVYYYMWIPTFLSTSISPYYYSNSYELYSSNILII